MYEAEVVSICGEPYSAREVGYILRPYVLKLPGGRLGSHGTRRVWSGFNQQLAVRELLYNFGPHKLMRVIRFEGGKVASIDTAGYGHHVYDD